MRDQCRGREGGGGGAAWGMCVSVPVRVHMCVCEHMSVCTCESVHV